MFVPFYTNQFKKDFKLQVKRQKDIQLLNETMSILIDGKNLSSRYRDHSLKGRFKDYRECHIESDWLLIYKIEENHIFFTRTGTHSDLFE